MMEATSIFVTLVIPCNPGDKFTSETSGPFGDGKISTAQLSHPVALAAAIANFLEAMFEAGAFAGATAADSFYVKCDASNNTGEMAGTGQLLCEVGVAPAIPAEFVVFRVGRTRDKLEITES